LNFCNLALGGSKYVNVSTKEGKLSISLKKGAQKYLSKEQLAGVKYMQEIIEDGAKVVFSVMGANHPDRNLVCGFEFDENHYVQKVDVGDLKDLSAFRNPLNTIIHETEERYQSVKNNDPRYAANHLLANAKEFEITGMREVNHRDDAEYRVKASNNDQTVINKYGLRFRFDYVDRNGNYLNTREALYNNGNLNPASQFDKNTPTQQVEEKKFKTSTIAIESHLVPNK
jgi:hypothetical protein